MKRCPWTWVLFLCGVLACARVEDRVADPKLSPPVQRPLDPDNEPGAVSYDQLVANLGALERAGRRYRVCVVLKFLGNQHWQLVSQGIEFRAAELDVAVDIRAAASKKDPQGQLQIVYEMLDAGCDALIISPQTADNLAPAVKRAREAGVVELVVDDVVADAAHWVGPNQYELGRNAALYLQAQLGEGQVAVIEGLPGTYAAQQRTQGFHETLQGSSLQVVAAAPANWDLQQSLEAAAEILSAYPDLKGFYCHNDVMALGAVEAVRAAGRSGTVLIVGTDGIDPAREAIEAGEMAATVDSMPYVTGQIALEIVVRLLEGQTIPRVVYSAQALVTRDPPTP